MRCSMQDRTNDRDDSTDAQNHDIADMRRRIRQAVENDERIHVKRGQDDIDEPRLAGDIELLWDGGGKTAARLHTPHERTYRITLINTVDGDREATAGRINDAGELLDCRPIHRVEPVEDGRQTVCEMHHRLRTGIGDRIRIKSENDETAEGVLYYIIADVEEFNGLLYAEDADPDLDDAEAIVEVDRPDSRAVVWMDGWVPREGDDIHRIETVDED